MRKFTNPQSDAKPTVGWTAAVALACTLAVAGCSTYDVDNPGAGEPTRGGAGAGPTVPSSTPGTSYGGNGNRPMTSAYYATAPIAVAANRTDFRTKYLGPADPGASVHSQSTVQTTQASNQSSGVAAVPVYIGDDAALLLEAPQTVATTGTTAGSTTGTTTIATNGTIAATSVTPAGLPAPNGSTPIVSPATAASVTTLNPTISSAAVASPTVFSTVAPSPTVASAGASSANKALGSSTTAPANGAVVTAPESVLGAGTADMTSDLASGMINSANTPRAVASAAGTTTTSRVRAFASTAGSPRSVSHPRAVSPTAGKTSTPRVHIVQSASGEVVITNQ